jgi:hypothetical protein
MRAVLLFFLALSVALGLVFIASPPRGRTIVRRAVHFFDPIPDVSADVVPARPSRGAVAPGAGGATPEWRRIDRKASLLYEAGDFSGAAFEWARAAAAAPSADAQAFRARADRCHVFALLAEGAPAGTLPSAGEAEREYRRRLEGLKSPTGPDWLALAEFAAGHGLRSHLSFLYEEAYARKHQGEEVQRTVTRVLRHRAEERKTVPPREVLEAVIRELPTSEAADIAREETGTRGNGPGGIGSSERRGVSAGAKPEDAGKLLEAAGLARKGDAEYRLAVPGSKDVNVHRRAALDAYTKARDLYETVDRDTGIEAHQREIHDLNRNIAELRKDLPLGK